MHRKRCTVCLSAEADITPTLTYAEIVTITGGRRRHRAQLEELLARGFHRARLGIDGKVVLERPHYEAVCAGQVAPDAGRRDTSRPQLHQVPPALQSKAS